MGTRQLVGKAFHLAKRKRVAAGIYQPTWWFFCVGAYDLHNIHNMTPSARHGYNKAIVLLFLEHALLLIRLCVLHLQYAIKMTQRNKYYTESRPVYESFGHY